MLFNSFQFLLFFPIVTLIYFLLPFKFRWFHLLVASCLFYMAFVPIYILILLLTIVIDYIAGIMIEKAHGKGRKGFLILSIVANLGILCFFKYYNFLAENLNIVLHNFNTLPNIPLLKIILPIGLSFHTFQAMSYTIEVYRGNQKAEKHFGIYALYVMFYPQLVAGPIERPQNILHQFHEKHTFDFDNCKNGLKLMLWGFFKKIVIADRLAIIVNNVYDHPANHSGIALAIGCFFFAFQIYCDFSGYSDIAIGAAQVMGYKLMLNFNKPFTSKSVTEFWRRWHISLSTWFFDYLFNPLVTNLRNWGGANAIVFGLLLTFFLSGFWHGAGWKFMIYGLINGIALVYEYVTKKRRKKIFSKLPLYLNNKLSQILTFGFLTFTWVFFRANNIHDALYIVTHATTGWNKLASAAGIKSLLTELGANDLVYGIFNLCIGILSILFLEFLQNVGKEQNNPISFLYIKNNFYKWSLYSFLFIAIITIGVFENQEFIYFQF